MLKISAPIVFSVLLLATGLLGKEVPLVKQIDIKVPVKEFSVIEFPFEIKSHDFTPFVSEASDDKTKESADVDFVIPSMENKELKPPKGAPAEVKPLVASSAGQKKSPIDASRGKNFLKLYPRKVGKTELLIWGYSKYPIMIKLDVVENDSSADKLITFVDFEEQKEEAKKFESGQHDKTIISLTKALYNNKPPKGYTSSTYNQEVVSGGLHFVLIKEFAGRLYTGQEYIVKNITSENITLDYDIFRGQKGFYGITFVHEILEPGKKTRLFVVKQRGGDE